MNLFYRIFITLIILSLSGIFFNAMAGKASANKDAQDIIVVLVTDGLETDGDMTVLDSLLALGFIVDEIPAAEVTAEDAFGVDFVYVSSTVTSSDIADKMKEVEVPVIMIEPYALDDMGMSLDDDQHRHFQPIHRPVIIEEPEHFLAAGLSDTIHWVTDDSIQSGQGYPGDEGVLIASFAADTADENMIYGVIFAYEAGDEMADSTLAPERRYFTGWNDLGAAYGTADGWKLWHAAIDWVLYNDLIDVDDQVSPQPEGYTLVQNYPNPFNQSTVITYSIPSRIEVKLTVYDIQGKEVARLVDGMKDAGTHTLSFNAPNLASGIYFYKLQTGSKVSIKKMTLLK
jgi:hypothetical protein